MTARHYPYTGGDPGSPHFDAVPTWLNDLLLEQTPGREMRNFRLAVRKAWMADVRDQRLGFLGPVNVSGLRRGLRGTSGVSMEVVEVCIDRWNDGRFPKTREQEDLRAQQA